MKTQTVIALGILAALGLGAYYLYTKNQAKTNTTTVGIPIGSGGLTATIPTSTLGAAAGSLLGGLVSDIGGVFSGGSGTQTVATNYYTDTAIGATANIGASTAYSDTTSDTGFATGTWDDFSF